MHRHRKSLWSSRFLSISFSSFIGMAVTLLLTLIFSAVILLLLKDMMLSGILTLFSLACGSFTGSYICGRYRRHHGLAEGIICGAVIYAVIFVFGLAFCLHPASIKKLLLLTISGAAGGVCGVNSKMPKGAHDQ